MGNFNRGRRDFNRRDGGNRGHDRPMYRAVCDNCGKECEVPFRPTQGKPIYCNDCFRENGGGRRDDRPRRDNRNDRGSNAPQPDYKEQLDYLNAKLDKILRLLEPAQPQEEVVVIEKKKRTKKEAPVEVPITEAVPAEIPPAETPQE